MAAVRGGDVLVSTIESDGLRNVVSVNASGQPTNVIAGLADPETSWSADWYATTPTTTLASIAGDSFDYADSVWFMPQGTPSRNAAGSRPVATQTRAALTALALTKVGSTNWPDTAINQCNLFVHDMLQQVGITPPLSDSWGVRRFLKYLKEQVDTVYYPALAADWASPGRTMKDWKLLTVPSGAPGTAFPSDYALAGDVLAEAITYRDATGHVGIVSSPGHTISADSAVSCYAPPAIPGTITNSDYGFRPDGWVDPMHDVSGQPCRQYGFKRNAVVKRFSGQ